MVTMNTTKKLVAAIALTIGLFGNVIACDDHIGQCTIENWRVYIQSDSLWIEGVASCDSGELFIRVYEGDNFVGVMNTYIEGHIFTDYLDNLPKNQYESISIRYSIDPDG